MQAITKLGNMLSWIWGRKREPAPLYPHNRLRRTVDTQSIRNRLGSLGWTITELPVRSSSPDPKQRKVVKWKLIASLGEKSCQVDGLTLDEAMNVLGTTLGVIARS